jgi:2-hydroxy-4-carboxymuconate semialdehyde hemiacetal dehydrogenase
MRIAVAGEGAFGARHLEGLSRVPDVELALLVGGVADATEALAARFGVPKWTTSLDECLSDPAIEAVILATPTPMHAAQAIRSLEAGKPVEVEIPMADNLADAERLVAAADRAGLVAMAGHTRRFNPSHQWVHRELRAGRLTLHQLEVQTHFLRRSNLNALGQPRSWTDHLLWHHAAHSVDLFICQTGESPCIARALQGPPHPKLGIAMDMSIQLKVPSGAICSLSLSFNNDGPLGSVFRYICDNGTYIARYDDLVDGHGKPVDVSGVAALADGVSLQDREFIDAIRERREPRASVRQVLPAYRVLDALAKDLAAPDKGT